MLKTVFFKIEIRLAPINKETLVKRSKNHERIIELKNSKDMEGGGDGMVKKK